MSTTESRFNRLPETMLRCMAILVCTVVLSALPNRSSATWNKIMQQNGVGKVSASWFFNDHIGIIGWDGIAWAGTMQRTTDGGLTWTNCIIPKQTNTAPFITDIFFPPAAGGDGTPYLHYSDTGYCTVAGSLNIGDPRVWVTYDSGKTWKGLPSSSGFAWATSVRLTTHALVVAEGAGVGVHVSIDSGKSWATSFSKFNGGLDFLDNSWGVATSVWSSLTGKWGQFLYTSDGGRQWQTAGANFYHESFGVYAMKHTSIFLSVPEDSLLRDGSFPGSHVYRSMGSSGFGTNWTDTQTRLPFRVNGGIAGINNVVFVQNSGTFGNYAAGLYRSRDSGKTWTSIGGPNENVDVRFSVQTCGLVIYAFDDNGGIWKTTDGGDGAIIPECVCLNKDTLRALTSTICTKDSATYWIHNPNIAEVVIEDIRLLDSTRRPAKSGALQVDSLPANYEVILAGDSVAFKLGWNPHIMMDSTAGDSATIRIILYAGYLERVMVRPLDTFYLRVKLRGNGEPPVYTQNTKTVKLDAVTTCTVDSVINIKNIGCDSLRITKALLVKNSWSLTDSLGKPVKLPVTLKVGESIRMFVHAITNGPATVQDSLAVTMHYQGKDSLIGVGLRVNANLPNPLTSPQALAFDSVATCASIDKYFTIADTGCAATSLTINQIDLSPLTVKDWILFDSSGNVVLLPLTLQAGSHKVFRLHFAPKNLGITALSVVIHTQGTAFTNTIALSGYGAPSGTLSYSKSLDFGPVPFCGAPAKDTFIVFNNTSCDPALVDSVLLSGDFTLLDPLSLPMPVASGKSVSVHVLYHPTGKGTKTGTAKLVIFTNNGQTKIIDSLSITATAIPGISTFDPTPALAPVTFATRSTCANLDSVVYTIKNTGCDTMTVTGITFDPAIAGDFEGHSDTPLPILVPGGQSVRFVVAMAQLAPGTHAGNCHLRFVLADGSSHDSVFAVSVVITQGQGTSTISSTTPLVLDFGGVHSCQSRDTEIVYTAEGCGSLIVNRSISGAGFTMSSSGDTTLQPKGKDVLHVHYSNSTVGASNGVVTIKTGPPQNQTITYNVSGLGLPVDTVHFLMSFSKMPVGQGESFFVWLKPDRVVSKSAGLRSVAGVLDFYADAFLLSPGSITSVPGVTVNSPSAVTVGKIRRTTFVLTSGSDIALDPSTPIMTAALVAYLADSIGVTISVDSLVLNGDNASFRDCALFSTVLGLQSQFATICGDSTLVWYMRGKPLITDRIRPNPLTSLDGYHGMIDLNPALDGVAEINVSDALGRIVSQSSVVLRGGEATSYPFDLVKQSAGTYFYSIRFVSEHGTAMHNGTLLLLK